MGYSTSKSTDKRHEILRTAVSDYGKQRVVDHITFLVNIRMSQKNGATKFANAISIWKSDIAYVRGL